MKQEQNKKRVLESIETWAKEAKKDIGHLTKTFERTFQRTQETIKKKNRNNYLCNTIFMFYYYLFSIMSKVFRITPKRTRRVNGQVITPEMVITVTTRQHCTNPFYNGAVEVKEQYMRMYNFDYKKACMSVGDFTYEALD